MMNRLKCACLVVLKENRLLLVRVRDNAKWYFPGGKIELGETAEETLIRESAEELNITIFPDSIRYLTTTVGPAYRREGEVELHCFSAKWQGNISPSAEISEVAFLDYSQRNLLAPAIAQFCDEWLDPYLAKKGEVYDNIEH